MANTRAERTARARKGRARSKIAGGAFRANTAQRFQAIGQAGNVNFGVNYGTITQNAFIQRADMLSLLNPILDASHTRNIKLSPPNSQCLPGTRTEVIGDIWAWATSDRLDARPHMLWVFGYAGCGKSAVAHEVAKILADENRLAACFVFSRGSGDRSSSARLATTIASQIASAVPELEPIIESTVRRNPGLLSNDTTSLSAQFKHLVYLPIQAIASKCSAPFIIVLSGVDECYDRDDVSTLIEDMIQFFDRHPNIPVRFLITSRVEDHLYQILHLSGQVQLLNLVEKTSDADIAAALTVAIQKEARGQVLSCHGPWPSASDTAKLVKHIGGSFMFMTTILKVLFDRSLRDGLTPMERLPLLLGMYPDFDELYREILEPWQYLPHFCDIISTIVLAFRPLSIAVLSEILNIKTYNVTNVLIHLHAIIQVPGDDRTPITLWHTSLRDYLCAEGRSGSLFVEPSYHRRLAQRCISLASISVNRKDLSSSEYARRYAIKHLATLVETTELDPELLHEDLCRAMRLLEIPVYDNNQSALEIACRASTGGSYAP